MTAQPRISDFWLDPSRTIDRREWPLSNLDGRYFYAMERFDGVLTVHRFKSPADRDLWVALGKGTREKLGSRHRLVEEAKEADDWPEDDDS